MEKSIQKVSSCLSSQEIRTLLRSSNWKGWQSVATTWGIIAACFYVAAMVPHPAVWLLACILIGGRQLGLAILMHETSHRSLFASKQLNDWVGKWLCAAPTWNDLDRYRKHHLQHHAHAGSEKDPDLGLTKPFPAQKASLIRKIVRDLTGITGLRRIAALVLMDCGYLSYTAATGSVKLNQSNRTFWDAINTGARNMGPVFATNIALWATLYLLGHGWLYALWFLSWLTTFSLFLRIRSIAEHACTAETLNPFENTRTTHANWLARLTVAPHHVNYHLEHHLLMTVPHYNLPKMHRLLVARGHLKHSPLASSYLEVLKTVSPTKA